MALEVTGRLVTTLPTQSGEGKNGTWTKGSFVIETADKFPKKVCLTVWGDLVSNLNAYQSGDELKVSFDVESREYNGRWYTDLKAWKIEKAGVGNSFSNPASNNFPTNEPNSDNSARNSGPALDDDLPF